jgi:hypothetical protein
MRLVLAAFYSARLGPGQREHWESPPEFAVGEGGPRSDVKERGVE